MSSGCRAVSMLLGVLVVACWTCPATGQAIDWDKARKLYQRERSGEKLSAEEQAYLGRAKAARGQRPGAATSRPDGRAAGGRDSFGLTPLTELVGDARYKGQDGGLYGGGSNEPPREHAAAAAAAVARIQPLDSDGKPAADGKIVMISMGMSNTTQEFSKFKEQADKDEGKSPRLVIVDCAQGGMAAPEWNEPATAGRVWEQVDRRLAAAGVSPKQVQVVFIKQAIKQPGRVGGFPGHAEKMKSAVIGNLHRAMQRFPNLRVAFLSSRTYGGYGPGSLNPEPFAYEGAFAVRWIIQEQIKGAKELNHDPANGEVKSPVVVWGPYLWADGINPRKSDGLCYKREDFGPDGTHPSQTVGRAKIADVMLKFFKSDRFARPWFLKPATSPPAAP